jgi:hypothetical protein
MGIILGLIIGTDLAERVQKDHEHLAGQGHDIDEIRTELYIHDFVDEDLVYKITEQQ